MCIVQTRPWKVFNEKGFIEFISKIPFLLKRCETSYQTDWGLQKLARGPQKVSGKKIKQNWPKSTEHYDLLFATCMVTIIVYMCIFLVSFSRHPSFFATVQVHLN